MTALISATCQPMYVGWRYRTNDHDRELVTLLVLKTTCALPCRALPPCQTRRCSSSTSIRHLSIKLTPEKSPSPRVCTVDHHAFHHWPWSDPPHCHVSPRDRLICIPFNPVTTTIPEFPTLLPVTPDCFFFPLFSVTPLSLMLPFARGPLPCSSSPG